jgi:hypothetical protein
MSPPDRPDPDEAWRAYAWIIGFIGMAFLGIAALMVLMGWRPV